MNDQNSQEPTSQAAAAQKLEEVFHSMGQAMLAISTEQEALKAKLNEVITNQNAQVQLLERLTGNVTTINANQEAGRDAITSLGNLAQLMDKRIHLISQLIDHHHNLMIAHNWAAPRPTEDPNLVN